VINLETLNGDIVNKIMNFIKTKEIGASASQISRAINHNRVTITKYLEVMKAQGILTNKIVAQAKLWVVADDHRKPTVLIVEDEKNVLDLVKLSLIPGQYNIVEGLFAPLCVAVCFVFLSQERACPFNLLLKVRLEKTTWIGIEFLRDNPPHSLFLFLACDFLPLKYKAKDVLPQLSPCGMRLGWGEMLDRELVIQEEAESEHLGVQQKVYVLTPRDKRVKGHNRKEAAVNDHVAAKDKGRLLQPRLDTDKSIKPLIHPRHLIPISHPGMKRLVEAVFTIRLEIIPCHCRHGLAVDFLPDKLRCLRHEL